LLRRAMVYNEERFFASLGMTNKCFMTTKGFFPNCDF
jgi:hypothetical protein